MNRHTILTTALVLALGGCGGAAAPTAARTSATASIEAARAVGAPEVPEASLHLSLAEEQLAHAEALIEEGQNAKAERALRRAEIDADLAVALARYGELRDDAERTREHIADMREQNL